MPGKKNTSRKSRTNSQKNPITYQNKDVVSKICGEQMKEKTLSVYGVNRRKYLQQNSGRRATFRRRTDVARDITACPCLKGSQAAVYPKMF